MRYVEPVFRPPSEGDSYILQITYGCSYNKCTFCSMYKSKKFQIRPVEEVKEDIDRAKRVFPDERRVFLADGDGFILKTEKLVEILEYLNKAFPYLHRVGIYSNPHGILEKSEEELKTLKKLKLRIAYLGLESGSDLILKKVNKGYSSAEMIESVVKAQSCGIKMSVIVLLGLGGNDLMREHALKTAEILNKMEPRYLSALTLMPVKGTILYEEEKKGFFTLPGPSDILKEMKVIIENLNLKGTVFRSNHASNFLPLEGRFPKDKEFLINQINSILEDENMEDFLVPDFFRGL